MAVSKAPRLRRRAELCYLVVAVMFTVFFVYMLAFARMEVYHPRGDEQYTAVADVSESIQPDEQAPAGVNRVFRWKLETDHLGDSLNFYVIHHYVKVYLDGELVYSLQPDVSNRIGKTTGSNWIWVPLSQADNGAEVTVVATPVYKSVISREIQFLVGSRDAIFADCLLNDADVVMVSAICIFVGLFIMGMQVYQSLRKKLFSREMFYLGNFALLLGVWRVTDTRLTAFLVPGRSMALGYVTIGCLMILAIPLMLFLMERLSGFGQTPLLHTTILLSAAAVGILLAQVLGIADLRELLTVSHILFAVTAAVLVTVIALHRRECAIRSTRRSAVLVLLLLLGAAADCISFYAEKNSQDVVYTALAFAIVMIYLFTMDTYETKNKAYTDARTGLFNKNRWDELMNDALPLRGNLAVLMMDLNGLKNVNDTYGHEAGDRMIFDFANILRNTLPPGTVICRWGGDEFTAMLMDSSPEAMERYVDQLHQAAQRYNESGKPPYLYFAAGWALASEFPELSREELLARADDRMYQEKRRWYSAQPMER